MTILSPLTVKRFRSFRRIKRAWYALWVFCAIFIFCMMADLVCPCDPRAVVDPATLEKYREPIVEQVYDIKAARFSLLDDGTIADYEGPEEVLEEVKRKGEGEQRKGENSFVHLISSPSPKQSQTITLSSIRYHLSSTKRSGYTRVFLEPVDPPAVTTRTLPAPEVSFPFRPVKEHPFGIDAGGRDVYARVVHGMRIALVFGIVLAFSGMFIGLVIGAIEGYFGGRTDIALQRMTEIWSAIPFMYVMIFIGSTIGRSFTILLVCYAIFNWIAVSYYMRAEFLRLRSRTFVEAAKVQGFSSVKIIFSHVLPNALTPLITLFPFLLMGAIGSLAALDFLGFGLPPMTPSCGELMNQAQQFRFAWWLILFPAAALFIVMLLAVLIGEGLRDAFDPRQRSRLE